MLYSTGSPLRERARTRPARNFCSVTATIANNVVTNNLSPGISCSYCPTVTIVDNTITANSLLTGVDWGVGVFCDGGMSGAAAGISHNTISGNTGSYEGAGILCGYVTATVDANLIENNSCDIADSPYRTWGAGLSIWDSDSSAITNNIFANNVTNSTVEFGMGGRQGGGAIYTAGNTNLSIVNNTFVSNGSGTTDSAGFETVRYRRGRPHGR